MSDVATLERARQLLRELPRRAPEADIEAAGALAELIWRASREAETPSERRARRALAHLVSDAQAQGLATVLTDWVSRLDEAGAVLDVLGYLRGIFGAPEGLGSLRRWGVRAAPALGALAPELVAGALAYGVRREAGRYVLTGTDHEVRRALRHLRAAGARVNLNHLGEEVVGEAQAAHHLERYLELTGWPEVTTLSVKLSSIFSQINLLAREESLDVLAGRLRRVYERALAAQPAGGEPKLVYLDMEAYRDLEPTLALFMRLLDAPELAGLTAGVVLQAYLPDSALWQRRLTEWAMRRVAAGGAPVRLRLVKGANLAAERVESSLRGWPLPVLPDKAAVDANFKHMLRFAALPEHAAAVRLGVASHNVFDVAYALVLRARLPEPAWIEPEMLYGMAEPLRRTVQALCGSVLVYLPTVSARDFDSAIAYLVRRFDENSGPENFLRQSFSLEASDAGFEAQRAAFVATATDERRWECLRPPARGGLAQRGSDAPLCDAVERGFVNEADTDLSRPVDREFLRACLRDPRAFVDRVPVVIGGQERVCGDGVEGFDPSRPRHIPYWHRWASSAELEQALEAAQAGARHMAQLSAERRAELLMAVAGELRGDRGELVRALVLDGGKRAEEADAEVSEAIDFAEYYARSYLRHARALELAPRGVVVVTPPWNFPLAIPLGGVLAALVAGNAVILKPAPETVLVAYRGLQACWRAGVPGEALQFVPCRDADGAALIRDERVGAVILTGASDTARLFRRLRPGLHLLAETGGKNPLIVDASADREAAIRDAVRSAFAHAGQKCSAASLLIVDRGVLERTHFLEQLRDATESLAVGSAWDPQSFVTPLIHPPSGALKRGLELEGEERWLVPPRVDADNPRLLAPAIKCGVRPGAFSHQRELFGPVLSVLAASSPAEALVLAGATPYGLTAGFWGLDERRQREFIERHRAGNLYVNRTTTGAIVGRQPFGGHKASSFGPGAKAGGPAYVLELCHVLGPRARRSGASGRGAALGSGAVPATGGAWRTPQGPESGAAWAVSAGMIQQCSPAERAWLLRQREELQAARAELDEAELAQATLGEANWLRHVPARVGLAIGAATRPRDLVATLVALTILGLPWRGCVVGAAGACAPWLALAQARGVTFDEVSGATLADWLRREAIERLRALDVPRVELADAEQRTDTYIDDRPLLEVGRLELRRYLFEQSICVSYHRQGNLTMAPSSPRPAGLRRGA